MLRLILCPEKKEDESAVDLDISSTIKSNSSLWSWNTTAQLVDKSNEPDEWDKPKLSLNYHNVA